LIAFGEASLRHVVREYVDHYHAELNHQGKDNVLLFPNLKAPKDPKGKVQCREQLAGLLKYN
jgi:putative transposase